MRNKRGRIPKANSLYKNSVRSTFYIKNDIKTRLAELKEKRRVSISDFVNTALDKELSEILSSSSNNIRVVSLFSGCGGMDLGFRGDFKYLGKYYKEHGFDIVFANDIDKDACDTYEVYFKHKPICADIKEHLDNDKMIPYCDVVIGGFPCQDFSLAGKREGFGTERGRLYAQMKRVILATRPKIFIAENVKGLTNLEGALDRIKSEFASVGYNVSHHLLTATNYGVPQTRERVIITGIRKDCVANFVSPLPTHAFETWVSAKKAIDDLWGSEKRDKCLPNQNQYSQAKNYGEHLQGNKAIKPDAPSPTIRAEHHGNIEFHYNKKRRLTVRECARIQSFPDDFVFKGSGSSAYVQIGNAVPPVMAWHIAKSVKDFFDNEARLKDHKQDNVMYSV